MKGSWTGRNLYEPIIHLLWPSYWSLTINSCSVVFLITIKIDPLSIHWASCVILIWVTGMSCDDNVGWHHLWGCEAHHTQTHYHLEVRRIHVTIKSLYMLRLVLPFSSPTKQHFGSKPHSKSDLSLAFPPIQLCWYKAIFPKFPSTSNQQSLLLQNSPTSLFHFAPESQNKGKPNCLVWLTTCPLRYYHGLPRPCATQALLNVPLNYKKLLLHCRHTSHSHGNYSMFLNVA